MFALSVLTSVLAALGALVVLLVLAAALATCRATRAGTELIAVVALSADGRRGTSVQAAWFARRTDDIFPSAAGFATTSTSKGA